VITHQRPSRQLLTAEIVIVLGLSLGLAGARAAVYLLGDLTAGKSLARQSAVLNGSAAPGRPWLDLTLQILSITASLVPVALVGYLLIRSGEQLRDLGIDRGRPWWDLGVGAGLAALVGGIGLGLYLVAQATGVNLTVVPTALPDTWWRIPVLAMAAVRNGILEEVLVVGYLIRRLDQLGWHPRRTLLVSATLRGTYHLYQGLGGFIGNVAMGWLFGWLYQRYGRVAPLIVAHSVIDLVAFIGYVLLVGRVGWLPSPSAG
jgi:membrane protease YdiL (CAAX protease family)